MKKYNITEESMTYKGCVLWRIQHIATQEKGGWIQEEQNLSQEGGAWIAEEAKVYGEACVSDDACISGNAEIFGSAQIRETGQVYGEAKVYDEAIVEGVALVYDRAEVCGKAIIQGAAEIYGDACIRGERIFTGNQRVVEREYTWEDVNSIQSLKIVFSGGQRENRLYANGRHQVGVHVNLVAKDKDNKILILAEDEVFKHMEFVNMLNRPYGNDLKVSAEPGEYVLPIERIQEKAPNASLGVFYLSTTKQFVVENVCVRCVVDQKIDPFGNPVEKKVEYTTAKENNNGNTTPNYIILSVLPPRAFDLHDIDIQTIELKKADNYNSILTKHYIRFKDTANASIHHAECEESLWFHYKQKGNYKAFSTTTDSKTKTDPSALYTAVFAITKNWTIEVTSTNHDMPGLCLWTYRVWHGALWSNTAWNKPMQFSLFDPYGNDVKIRVETLDNAVLKFNIVK
ncbi:hypothetical protein [Myroides odoratus]|uniref:hypothetical protein n=1 Tax=Myroides odoratus TaxID=256 RepID=UPI002168AF13|nr:hypothetical protein [Myroides odoratus]MCS4239885.1 carbonic anhydrase/acetyltransferase-like protein (isoleucine patch superfamily) [Myroides odoratus]